MVRVLLRVFPVFALLTALLSFSSEALVSPEAPSSCPITKPNGNNPPGDSGPGGYGNEALWTNLYMWSEDGTVPVDREHVLADGEFGGMKWAWYRFVPGKLTIEGRRLDGPAGPLRADIPDGYGVMGFQVSGLIFPTDGCWEVTGRVGDASLTFVTYVIPPNEPIIPHTFWE
jgi:hypothetical protein